MTNQTPISQETRRGQNQLDEAKKATPIGTFFQQLNDPLIYILFAAAAIPTMLGEIGDTAIILVVIFVNAVVGVIQEGKAQRALDALKEMTSPTALIDINGIPAEIPAKDLIVGDLVYLDAGRQVPADLVLTSVSSLKIEESALTGESLPVEKDTLSENKAYMSTNVTYGKGTGRVTAIGMDTEIGKIAKMINTAPTEMTPLQKRFRKSSERRIRTALCPAFPHCTNSETRCDGNADYRYFPGRCSSSGRTARRCHSCTGAQHLTDGKSKYNCQTAAQCRNPGFCKRCLF